MCYTYSAVCLFLIVCNYVNCASILKSPEIENIEIDSSYLLNDEELVIPDEEIADHVRYAPERVNLIKCKQYHQISKVVNGRNAKPREFPHMAVLGYEDSDRILWECGGSLISDKFVLTAAHCLRNKNGYSLKYVRLGDLDIKSDTDDASPQQFTVKKLFIHPSYKSPNRYHDIALIQLNRKVKFTKYVIPACVGLSTDLNGTKPTVGGWGLRKKGGSPSNILQTAPMEYVSADACRKTYPKSVVLSRGFDDDLTICAGGGTNKTDTCQGDSGGPLQIINQSYDFGTFAEIVGVTSFGKSCGFVPGAYTRVQPHMSWIREIVWSFLFKSAASGSTN